MAGLSCLGCCTLKTVAPNSKHHLKPTSQQLSSMSESELTVSKPTPDFTKHVTLVLELFTSEGCSSCPAADELLAQLDAQQPVSKADLLIMEMHVDYWNYLGWPDPFSSAPYTERQRGYAEVFQSHKIYTPQLVVQGTKELVGSSKSQVLAAVSQAAAQGNHVELKLNPECVQRQKGVWAVTVNVGPHEEVLDVWFVVTEAGLVSQVKRGENAGSTLRHAPVARKFSLVPGLGQTSSQGWSSATVELVLDPAWRRDHLKLIAFAQTKGMGAILGAAWQHLAGADVGSAPIM